MASTARRLIPRRRGRLGPDGGALGGAGRAGAGPRAGPDAGCRDPDGEARDGHSDHRSDGREGVRQPATGPTTSSSSSRISFRRTTPEGWERTITRMMALNGVKIDAPTARAGREVPVRQPAALPRKRRGRSATKWSGGWVDENASPKDIEGTCNACHSVGRVLSQRRTRQEWELLIAMHRGYYPIIDRQTYRRMGPAPTRPRRVGPATRPAASRPRRRSTTWPRPTRLKRTDWAAWSRRDAPGAHRGHVGALGLGARQGPGVRPRRAGGRADGAADEFTSQITYHLRAHRPDR